jgi:hypothetical protein
MASAPQIRTESLVHRIGGSALDNLQLKLPEMELDPPGFSVFLCETAEDAAYQVREAFPHATRLLAASQTVASATVEAIRRAGFDVISDPTRRFANHARLIHPDGVGGFVDENLKRLSAAFRDTMLE